MNLAELFNQSNIRCVHIVDDAFDAKPSFGLEPEEVQAIIEGMTDQQFDELCGFFERPEMDDAELLATLTDVESVAKLFDARDQFGAAVESLFNEFLTERAGKLAKITPLINRLEAEGVACLKFGSDYAVENTAEPQLIFIDLMLKRGPVTVDDAVKVCQKLLTQHSGIKPFIFLMSSLTNATFMERREEFRKKAMVFSSQFEAVEKAIFSNAEELDALLCQCARFHPELVDLHRRVNSVEKSIKDAAVKVRDTLQNMDMADYFVLHQNTVAIEKVKLGTYISDLLLEYLVQEVESSEDLWSFAKLLDTWKLESLPRSRFGLTYAAGKIYSGNLLHSKVRLKNEAERQISPEHGYFYLGDIFLEKSALLTKPEKALVIATPACDLVRPENLRNRTILLCEGSVSVVNLATVPGGDGGIPTTIIPHPIHHNKQLAIKWNKKKFRTWVAEDLEKFKDGSSEWKLVDRLRPLYAIQLQHAITADLSRIGVQRAPNLLIPCGIQAFVSNGDKWVVLDSEEVNEPQAAAYSDSEDGKSSLFIISDPTVRRIIRNLKVWLQNNPLKATAPLVEELLSEASLEQRLMYHSYQINKDQNLKDVCGTPLSGCENSIPDSVVLVRPTTATCYNTVCGGGGVIEGQSAVVVIKFKRALH